MQSRIGDVIRYEDIFTEYQYQKYFASAKQSGTPYRVIPIEQSAIKDFKELVKLQNWARDTNNQPIKWSKVREAKVSPEEPYVVSFQYDFSSEYLKLDVKKKRGRPVVLETFQIPAAYR